LRAFRALFYTGTVIQLITAPVHLLGTLRKAVPANDQERMLLDLLYNYKFHLGTGFGRSMGDFLTGFSLLYSVFILILGLINLLAIRQADDSRFFCSLCWLNVLCMAACTGIAFAFFFLPPLLFSLVPFVAFLGAALTASRQV
jgi:hypothetical protein